MQKNKDKLLKNCFINHKTLAEFFSEGFLISGSNIVFL